MEKFEHAERIEKLLKAKTFQELSDEERLWVLEELGSEEHYDAMRKIDRALITARVDLSPDPHILPSLQSRMTNRSESWMAKIFNVRIPAYAMYVAVMVAVVLTWSFVRPLPQATKSERVEVMHRDTIYVASKPDTIYRDRVVYRQVLSKDIAKQKSTEARIVSQPLHEEKAVGVSMKENEELQMLLVSGSR